LFQRKGEHWVKIYIGLLDSRETKKKKGIKGDESYFLWSVPKEKNATQRERGRREIKSPKKGKYCRGPKKEMRELVPLVGRKKGKNRGSAQICGGGGGKSRVSIQGRRDKKKLCRVCWDARGRALSFLYIAKVPLFRKLGGRAKSRT